ncbi:MAG TPA: hypothetical protein VNC78_02765 [Actinomycetota bacterium]|nr:hypothetical protein [Actinomycetota bacterium]
MTATLSYQDRSDRGKLRFTGEQRAWFLHQIMTQAFEDIAPGEARDTSLITAHGRMVGYLETVATEEAIYAHFEPELKETLPEAIRKYIIATRVEVVDADDMSLVLVVGESWREVATAAAPDALLHPTESLGAPAGYIWIEGDAAVVIAQLAAAGAETATEDDLETLRVRNGVPRWGRDMNEKTIPFEAGIEDRTISFTKGCYVGQEAMSKINFRGKVNRKLRLVSVSGSAQPGDELTSRDEVVGRITSVIDGHGLAMLNHSVEEGARLGAPDAEVTVAP